MAYRSGSALGLSINSGPMHLYGQAYFVGLPLPDGPHTLSVILATPDGAAATRPLSPPPLLPRPPKKRTATPPPRTGAHQLTPEAVVRFAVDSTAEYEEDGAGPGSDAVPPAALPGPPAAGARPGR
jgi:hypothetical protein